VTTFTAFYVGLTESSLPCSQEPATCLYPEPDESKLLPPALPRGSPCDVHQEYTCTAAATCFGQLVAIVKETEIRRTLAATVISYCDVCIEGTAVWQRAQRQTDSAKL